MSEIGSEIKFRITQGWTIWSVEEKDTAESASIFRCKAPLPLS